MWSRASPPRMSSSRWTPATTTRRKAPSIPGAAWPSGKTDRLTVVSNSYAADQTRMHVSQMLELPIHKVRVISKYVGGQFGRGDTGDQPFFLFTALLAKKAGRPVKFKHTRRDSFHDTRQARALPLQGGRHGRRHDHRAPFQVHRRHRRARRPLGLRAEIRPGRDLGGRAGPDSQHQDGILCRLHQPHPRLHDARGGQFPVQLHLRPDDRWPGRAAGYGPDRAGDQELRARMGHLPGSEPDGGAGDGRAAHRLGREAAQARRRPALRGRQEARGGLLPASRLACRVAGRAPRAGAGEDHPLPGRHGHAGRAHRGDRHRLEHLQCAWLRRGARLPGRPPGGHHLGLDRGHR